MKKLHTFTKGSVLSRRLQWGGGERCGEKTLEFAPWDIAQLGSCSVGKYHWEVATWENTIGKLQVGKSFWEITFNYIKKIINK